MSGLVLVLDMDQTIIDSEPFFRKQPLDLSKIPEYLNMNVIDILLKAAKLRPRKVKCIFLLTNNSDKEFIAKVDSAILNLSRSVGKYNTPESKDPESKKMPQKEYFFDDIFMMNHSMRTNNQGTKDLHTIMEMIHTIDPRYQSNVMKNLFFFDDIPNHRLKDEFEMALGGKYSDHYITITPPYKKGLKDKTDYTPILKSLRNVTTTRKNRRS